jgi:hypothetical protein
VLTPALKAHVGGLTAAAADPLPVTTFRKLVEHVAALSYLNKDHLLFFRGQGVDYLNKAGASTLYPSIYRGESLKHWEIEYRFDILEEASRQVEALCASAQVQGHQDVSRKKHIQWSILQHYQVCETPLLDVTHSLRVACSFAQHSAEQPACYVYVLGLPYLTNRISVNSEHDLVNVRLLSICPPQALRPYFQDGYLAGTTDITSRYSSKTELDFRNRLVAKFEIPRSGRFWGPGFNAIPESVLFPRGDRFEALCEGIQVTIERELRSEDLGRFVKEWARLEGILVKCASAHADGVVTAREATDVLARAKLIDLDMVSLLDELRLFRNTVIHKWDAVEPEEVTARTEDTRQAATELSKAMQAP